MYNKLKSLALKCREIIRTAQDNGYDVTPTVKDGVYTYIATLYKTSKEPDLHYPGIEDVFIQAYDDILVDPRVHGWIEDLSIYLAANPQSKSVIHLGAIYKLAETIDPEGRTGLNLVIQFERVLVEYAKSCDAPDEEFASKLEKYIAELTKSLTEERDTRKAKQKVESAVAKAPAATNGFNFDDIGKVLTNLTSDPKALEGITTQMGAILNNPNIGKLISTVTQNIPGAPQIKPSPETVAASPSSTPPSAEEIESAVAISDDM